MQTLCYCIEDRDLIPSYTLFLVNHILLFPVRNRTEILTPFPKHTGPVGSESESRPGVGGRTSNKTKLSSDTDKKKNIDSRPEVQRLEEILSASSMKKTVTGVFGTPPGTCVLRDTIVLWLKIWVGREQEGPDKGPDKKRRKGVRKSPLV